MDIQKLLQSPSVDDYEAVTEGLKAILCEASLEYFETKLDLDIHQNAGRCTLEQFDLYNPNNVSEALTSTMKQLLAWKEKTGDIAYVYYWHINSVYTICLDFAIVEI